MNYISRTKTQISLHIRAVWSETTLFIWRNFAFLAIHNAHSKDSDQTARMRESLLGAHVCPKICCTCSDAAADSTSCNYRIYPKYSDTSTPYHICSKMWTSTIHYPMLCLKIAGWVANSVDPDGTPRSAASHLGLYCLLRPVCPNTYGKLDTTKQRVWFCEL